MSDKLEALGMAVLSRHLDSSSWTIVGTLHCCLSGNCLPSALPVSHTIQAEVSMTRRGTAINS
jgi:hypothetical protein